MSVLDDLEQDLRTVYDKYEGRVVIMVVAVAVNEQGEPIGEVDLFGSHRDAAMIMSPSVVANIQQLQDDIRYRWRSA